MRATLSRAFAAWLVGAAVFVAAAGDGVAAPDVAALREAAAGGDAEALFTLGDLHERGVGGLAHSFSMAAAYMQLAAERGHAPAQYRLGLFYVGGLGVPEDAVEGYKWLALAADRADAAEARVPLLAAFLGEAVAAELTPEALARAKRLAASFEAATGPAELPEPGTGLAAATRPGLPSREAVKKMVASSDCGEPRVLEREAGGYRVVGFRRDGAAGGPLDHDGEAFFARHSIELELTPLTASLCTVLNVLAANRAKVDPGMAVALRNRDGETKATFRDGEHLVIEVPSFKAKRYVFVDYFVHSGDVVHMFPNSKEPDNLVPAGTSLTLGDGGGRTWPIGPPFGRDLVVVFVSERPLYSGGRALVEASVEYVAFLRRRLESTAPDDDIWIRYLVVETVAG